MQSTKVLTTSFINFVLARQDLNLSLSAIFYDRSTILDLAIFTLSYEHLQHYNNYEYPRLSHICLSYRLFS